MCTHFGVLTHKWFLERPVASQMTLLLTSVNCGLWPGLSDLVLHWYLAYSQREKWQQGQSYYINKFKSPVSSCWQHTGFDEINTPGLFVRCPIMRWGNMSIFMCVLMYFCFLLFLSFFFFLSARYNETIRDRLTQGLDPTVRALHSLLWLKIDACELWTVKYI